MDIAGMAEGFEKARAAFIHQAAASYGAADAAVRVMPNTEAEVDIWQLPGRAPGFDPGLGAAWAFEARLEQPSRPVRGWATPEGVVITWEQNLGLLLEQADLWGADPQAAFERVLPRLIWALGPPHEPYGPAPTLHLSDDGSGEATLSTRLVIPGGPITTAEFTLHVGADHSASLSPATP